MKNIMVLMMVAVVSGCAMYQVDPALPSNVSLTPVEGGGYQYVDEMRFEYPLLASAKSSAAKCVALNVEKESVTMSDSSSSYRSSLTGRYISVGSSSDLAGGQVLQYADKDSGEVIANGRTSLYTAPLGMALKKIIDYKVFISSSDTKTNIVFSSIKGGFQDTGAAANSGLTPQGAWKGATPVNTYNTLAAVADKLANCMDGTSGKVYYAPVIPQKAESDDDDYDD